MKKLLPVPAFSFLLSLIFYAPHAFADKLLLSDNRIITGTVLQTNDGSVLLLTDYGTLKYPEVIIKEITIDKAKTAAISKTDRIPDSKSIVLQLSKESWASKLKQIPATVIDKGILRNVPYISFRCGEDYEVNIYGDLDHPSGIEAGVYRKLLGNGSSKSNCVSFMSSLLGQIADKAIVQGLDMEKDLKTFDGWTFEITPPTAEDSYQGWWVSVYSEANLNRARASDEEMNKITVVKTDTNPSKNSSAWSAAELGLARSPYPTTITFTDRSGNLIKNAEVVRVIDGSSLIWRDQASGGVIKLADLPVEQQNIFGYDPIKAAAAEKAEQQKQAQLAAAVAASSPVNQAQYGSTQDDSDSSYSTSGGRVYVRGYTKSNGTYVQPYSRRR